MELPGAEHFENYMRHKWRLNRRPNASRGSFVARQADICPRHTKKNRILCTERCRYRYPVIN
jgi:hypothetical protein